METNSELALKFQEGDKQAGKKLISNFDNLIINIANLIYHKKDNHTTVINNLRYLISKNKFNKVINVVSNIYKKFSSYEDIVHDIVIIFIDTALNYRPSKIKADDYMFESYINNYIHYNIKKQLIDTVYDVPVNTESIDNYIIYDNDSPENILFNNIDDWINGDTNSVFSEISREDRELLKEMYINDYSIKDIADKRSLHQSTIYKRLDNIKNKLEGLI